MTRSTQFRFSLFEISFAILAALALALSPQAALAQHGGGGGGGHAGGGGHIGGGGGGHFSGGGGHGAVGFGTGGHSNAASHASSSPVHVFSGPRSAPAAAPARAAENSAASMNPGARVSAIQPRSSTISAAPSGGLPRGTGMFAGPRGSSAAAAPMHTTIGFPPSTDPRFASIANAHRGAPLMITGQGQQLWHSSQDAAANRNSAHDSEIRVRQGAFPRPPHIPRRRPIAGGPPFFIGSPGFFFGPTFGFFGPGFGCDPFWVTSFGCNGFGYGGFGYGGYNYLGYGGYGGAGYGYDGGYYAPPNFDVAPPDSDEGVSQEPAPSEWQNPPADSSSPDNSAVENEQQAPAPDTVIYLKDGTSFAVKNYWVADGQLHYVTSYGGENAVDLGAFDLERTTDENAKQGIAITLRPAPDAPPPANPAPQETQP